MDNLRHINAPGHAPGDLHHEDEAVLLAALWLQRHRNAVDLATMRDLKTRFGITTAQAVEVVRICNTDGGADG